MSIFAALPMFRQQCETKFTSIRTEIRNTIVVHWGVLVNGDVENWGPINPPTYEAVIEFAVSRTSKVPTTILSHRGSLAKR